MTFEERKLFGQDERVFLDKKRLFLDNARLTEEIKALHQKLKSAESDADRKAIADEIMRKDNERENNWRQIDELPAL